MKCRVCKEEKTIENFGNNKSKKNGKMTICKECKRIKDKESYDRRKIKINLQKKEKISFFRKEYNDLKKGKLCKKCGEDRYYLLDFHHLDDNIKDFNIGIEAWRSLNIEKIKKEIKKCVILCSNCHREYHFLNKEGNLKINEYLNVPVV